MKVLIVFSFLCLFFIVCSRPLIIAHKGASAHFLENSFAAFEKAIQDNADMIELDVQQCASGELVVFHDVRLERLTNGKGDIRFISWSDLTKLKVMGCEPIPLLQDVFDFIDCRIPLFIELKSSVQAIDIVKFLQQQVFNKNVKYDNFLVASFDHILLNVVKQIDPLIRIVPLVYGVPLGLGSCIKSIDAYGIGLDVEFISKTFVDDVHTRGLKVYVYTVNYKDDFMRVLDYLVDGIITDDPAQIINFQSHQNVI